MELSFLWPFHSLKLSPLGTKSSTYGTIVPGNESSLVRKFQLPPGTFVPKSECSIELSFPNIDCYYISVKPCTSVYIGITIVYLLV